MSQHELTALGSPSLPCLESVNAVIPTPRSNWNCSMLMFFLSRYMGVVHGKWSPLLLKNLEHSWIFVCDVISEYAGLILFWTKTARRRSSCTRTIVLLFMALSGNHYCPTSGSLQQHLALGELKRISANWGQWYIDVVDALCSIGGEWQPYTFLNGKKIKQIENRNFDT